MSGNFNFFSKQFPTLAKKGDLAESYLYSDPNTCIFKLGSMAETIVKEMVLLDNLFCDSETQADRIRALKRANLLPRAIDDILYRLRIKRNDAVHEDYDSFQEARTLLQLAHSLSIWFMRTYVDKNFQPEPFVLPEDTSKSKDYEKLLAEKESLVQELEKVKAEIVAKTEAPVSATERKKRSTAALNKMLLSEDETRCLIDEQLRRVGWEADSKMLRYSTGARPEKGKNRAIAEWPTDSSVCKWGNVDYALFVGTRLVGVVEAKAKHKDVSSIIDNQCRDYSRGIKSEHDENLIGVWSGYKVPFLFASNGRPYLKQLDTKSGIWFRDVRRNGNIPKALQNWITPQGLMELFEKDTETADQKLKAMPYDLLTDPDGLNLRPYQTEAIAEAERAVMEGQPTTLLAMATGTGKTRTVLGMIYRFLKTERFNRILFLVDRTALGEQAQDVFKEIKIEDLMTLDSIYNIKELDDPTIDKETKIHVATVQGLVQRVLYGDDDKPKPGVTDYDLIIVDEAHRGYILDKEIGETELLYRDQIDYMSKYRTVIEYFDAVKIALTATPALHTIRIFGKPVYEYPYRRAVIEGHLVDHDAPHDIRTRLRAEGIRFGKGETVPVCDPITGEITNSDELDDELKFDVDKFNRQVITENFNRTVLREIANDINPEGDGKTLIYAVDDSHADMIVKLLREIYEPMGVSSDAVLKITGSIGGGNSKRVQEAIKRFKNEKFPSIAVTVDLLTTGIDVPEITTLVFMRRVRSRILFEQMLGRATRLCPKIEKTHFEIYDPVGVYESLEPVNTMKPVVKNESATFDDLLAGLDVLEDEKEVQNQLDMIVAKIQRKRRALAEEELEQFVELSGGLSPVQVADKIAHLEPKEGKEFAVKNQELFAILDTGGLPGGRPVMISSHEDELLSHTRGYGDGKAPQDYLEDFQAFVGNNRDKIAALEIVCSRPRELTREALKSLKLELDRHHFTETQLQTAWKECKNEDIAADIISFIRSSVLDSVLLDHSERIRRAVEKLRKNHTFNKIQLDWLARIEKSLLAETVVDRETFETGAFRADGGFARINKIFAGQLDDYLQELNEYLYSDGGTIA